MADIDISWIQPTLQNLSTEIEGLRSQLSIMRVDLSGKDWLTVDEAAHYCGVSVSQFNARAHEYDLHPRKFMGKKLYEKSALYQAIYGAKAWARPSSTAAPPWWRRPLRWRKLLPVYGALTSAEGSADGSGRQADDVGAGGRTLRLPPPNPSPRHRQWRVGSLPIGPRPEVRQDSPRRSGRMAG